MTLRVYNTMTQRKEEFVPDEGNKVNMYVCGVTVYDYCHLGHARAIISFDIIRKYLLYKGFNVTFVQNFTDVDDKIIDRANENGVDAAVLAKQYIDAYFEDIDCLNVMRADLYPTVTENMQSIVDFVKGLIDKGYAYESAGDVYYSVRKFKGYGKLSKKNVEDLISGARIAVGEQKHDPLDFALWKKSKPGEPEWDSPWGKGRPGWHIECSVMSTKNLGSTLTIHGGGQDLIFPHHENEIAQSEAYTGKPFARYWMHNGFVTIDKEKMSKSLGNFFTLRDLYKKYDPMILRLFLIMTQYRSPVNYSQAALAMAGAAYRRAINAYKRINEYLSLHKDAKDDGNTVSFESEKYIAQFENAMDDDFNSAKAIGVLFDLVKEINEFCDKYTDTNENYGILSEMKRVFEKFDSVLGILPGHSQESAENSVSSGPPQEIKDLIEQRNTARKNRDFAEADRLRDEIKSMGYIIKDLPEGTIVEKIHE